MGICKDRISSPLEAGPSLLDSQKLSPQVSQALGYVSDRLMRKQLHLTLVVAREEAQPALRHPQVSSPTPSRSPTPSSFSKLHFPSLPSSPRSIGSSVSSLSSFSSSSVTSPTSPFTPFSPSFPTLGRRNTVTRSPHVYSICLHHTSEVSPKASRLLEDAFSRASKKYSLDSGWLLSPLASVPLSPTSSTVSTLSNDLIRRSLQQNEVVFGGEGLTLLALDHVYTFKCAISAYSRTLVPPLSSSGASLSRADKLLLRNQAKTRAVDELRLLVLSQKSRQISQSYLLRAYDHLSVSIPALRSVNEAYKTCFHSEGVEIEAAKPMLPNPQLLRSKSGRMFEERLLQNDGADSAASGVYMGPYYRAPATPTGYEEVTPITRSEWNSLMWGRSNLKTVESC